MDGKYGEKLYDMLPPLYHDEDAKIRPEPFPLKRFLGVAGVGLDFLEEKLKGHTNLFDIDRAPAEFLPHLAKMMGLDFPYDMTESEQRSFLKALPIMYKFKGTSRVFDYLGQVIFGANTRVQTLYRLNTDPLYDYRHVIDILIQVTGNTLDIPMKADRYRKFAELFRPINSTINPVVQSFYTDIYESITNGDTGLEDTVLYVYDSDSYDRARMKEVDGKTLLLNIEGDSYNKDSLSDAVDSIILTILPESDIYSNTVLDDHEDFAVHIGALLNKATLNNTMILNSKQRTIKL